MSIKDELKGAYYYNPKCDPLFAMSFDNWLFDKIQSDPTFPRVILRLYTWGTPAITLGYNQNIDKTIDLKKLNRSIPILRRITGGRAIYHDKTEITFSLTADLKVFPEKDRSLPKTNQLISGIIVKILDLVGVASDWAKKSDASFKALSNIDKKSCFNSYSRYEVFSRNAKIVAGAQRRKGDYFIHQGSIKINGVSDCPAIGQKGGNESGLENKNHINSYVYTINQFKDLFPDIFSKSLRTRLTAQMLDKELYEKICLLTNKFN